MPMSTLSHSGYCISFNDLLRLQYVARNLEMKTSKRSYGYQSGRNFSVLQRGGLEFSEVRPYQPGDDIRRMDWRVTARTGTPHTKLYHPERERTIFIVVDYSASMFFGTKVAFKSVIAAQAAGLLAWLGILQSNRVGGFILGQEKVIELRPRSQQKSMLPFLKALADASHQAPQKSQPQALNDTLYLLAKIAKPGSLIFLLSDFAHLDEQTEQYLHQLRQNNELRAAFIYDDLECNPPPPNQYAISNGKEILLIDTAQKKFCHSYHHLFAKHRDYVQQVMRKNGISLIELATHHEITNVLQQGLNKRC